MSKYKNNIYSMVYYKALNLRLIIAIITIYYNGWTRHRTSQQYLTVC